MQTACHVVYAKLHQGPATAAGWAWPPTLMTTKCAFYPEIQHLEASSFLSRHDGHGGDRTRMSGSGYRMVRPSCVAMYGTPPLPTCCRVTWTYAQKPSMPDLEAGQQKGIAA